MPKLVIVESPTKAKTIRNYLPKDYRVEASMGHVRDLPQSASDIPADIKANHKTWASLGVNVEDAFQPLYIIPKDKKKIVRELKAALKDADELLLATDEDREGESISWHLLQLLKPKVPTKRMVFHEITEEAIQKSLDNCRDINEELVHAQETRRILDRLVGYTLSPLLWKKVARGLSAGRVQSVAVRLLVRRERERRAFRQGSYWDLKAMMAMVGHEKNPFGAKLTTLAGTKVATGADFDENTGQITAGRNVTLLSEAEARALQDRLAGKPWTVSKLEEKPSTRKPSAPFTTSTLQQEANRKLRLSARDTMRVAQGLYERGYITYMRTDSVHLSQQAIAAARDCVEQKYGADYLSPEPRQFKTKSKNAQEAHEAVRPAGSSFRTPQETGLNGQDLALYDLIWKRTVATQMANARQTLISVRLQVEDAEFRSSGKRIDFPGFFRAYVEGSDDPDAALEDQEVLLPPLKEGSSLKCNELDAVGHETQPPARFTEASLVKALESESIGRPSTYASIISTIIDRKYATRMGNAMAPTFTAFAVVGLLENHFPELVDTSFTARMEQTLDDISMGEKEWLPYLEHFYGGDNGLAQQVKVREDQIDATDARTIALEDISAKVRIGKYGPYVEAEREPESDGEEPTTVKASIPLDVTPADLNDEQVEVLLRDKLAGPKVLGIHPEHNLEITLRTGSYGPYVQLGEQEEGSKKKPKRSSLPKGVGMDDVTLELSIGLLNLPRLLGEHPETGNKIQASLGRFGPYIVHKKGGEEGKDDYRSLKPKEGDDVLTVTLDRAMELLAQPKRGRGKKAAKTALRELGNHPVDEQPINIYDGPYGAYLKHNKTNVSVPEDEKVESITLEKAVELIDDKAGGPPKKKKAAAKKTTAKKTAAKKTTAKKTTAKKTATKKTTAKKATDKTTTTKKTATKKTAAKATAKTAAAKKSTKTEKTTAKASSKTAELEPVTAEAES